MIQINNLTKSFDKIEALSRITCSIGTNKIVGFVGPDGSGKTTLFRIIAGIMSQDSGDVLIDGKRLQISHISESTDTISQNDLHKIISYMPQKFGLYEDLTVFENLELYSKLHNISPEDKEKSFESVLSITRLYNFKQRLAGNLSGGMKQKLGLACSLLKKPRILILDEPSVGVDPISRQELIEMVNSMLDKNTTVLWSTAYLDEAENLEDVILLNSGKVIFSGSPKEAIKLAQNRVYLFQNIEGKRRDFATTLLTIDGVMDSVIQGKNVKFLSKNTEIKGIFNKIKEIYPEVSMPINWRASFEDACIDILGGLEMKESPISQYINDISIPFGNYVVEAISLSKTFGNFKAVDDVSFKLQSGRILGFLGPNGSGKSTTFRMLCGLLRQTSGTAKIAGIDISKMGSDAKMNIGYMAQKFSLYRTLSIKENLDFFAGAYGLKGRKKKEAIDQMIEIFHMKELQNINASHLSLGYKQRLSLACAIMHKPQILFLDEPTSGVDPITRKEFWLHINSMVSHGISVIVTTHFMDEAENCDEIALIYKGKIRSAGTPDDLKQKCQNVNNPTLEQAFMQIIQNVDKTEGLLKTQFDQ